MNVLQIEEELLNTYGVNLKELAEIVIEQQSKYNSFTMHEALVAINKVLSKTEVSHVYLVAFELDRFAQAAYQYSKKGVIYEDPLAATLADILIDDDPLFGVDETIAMSMSGLYGSIATTNYGYLDKTKPGVIGRLNDMGKSKEMVTTMIDDVVAATIACAEAYLSHNADTHKEKNND